MSTLAAYDEREELGPAVWDASAGLNDPRLELVRATEELRVELSGEADPVARSDAEKGISLRELAEVLATVGERASEAYAGMSGRWLDRLLGPGRAQQPSSYHAAYLFRLTPLADVYTKERATEICLETLRDLGCDLEENENIRTDLEDRPQKAPRPSVIASDPPTVVHLITRPMGGLQDYQDFLHEAGHALHYAGCDPALPFTFRALSRDYALTEIYSYIVQSIAREPGWHAAHFGLSPEQAAENAEAATFLDAFMFRRYLAKLLFELDFWSRFIEDRGTSAGYAERLTEATGLAYRPDRYLADMDSGFYSADYLRAWIRSAQLRSYLRETVGDDWWRRRETGDFLRELFREGLRPSNEEMAGRIGFEPLDVGPLLAEQTAVRHTDLTRLGRRSRRSERVSDAAASRTRWRCVSAHAARVRPVGAGRATGLGAGNDELRTRRGSNAANVCRAARSPSTRPRTGPDAPAAATWPTLDRRDGCGSQTAIRRARSRLPRPETRRPGGETAAGASRIGTIRRDVARSVPRPSS